MTWCLKVNPDVDAWMREYARAGNFSLGYAAEVAFRTLQAQVESEIAAKTEAEAVEPKTGAPKFSGNADETTVAL
jgi:hypothetical protein